MLVSEFHLYHIVDKIGRRYFNYKTIEDLLTNFKDLQKTHKRITMCKTLTWLNYTEQWRMVYLANVSVSIYRIQILCWTIISLNSALVTNSNNHSGFHRKNWLRFRSPCSGNLHQKTVKDIFHNFWITIPWNPCILGLLGLRVIIRDGNSGQNVNPQASHKRIIFLHFFQDMEKNILKDRSTSEYSTKFFVKKFSIKIFLKGLIPETIHH